MPVPTARRRVLAAGCALAAPLLPLTTAHASPAGPALHEPDRVSVSTTTDRDDTRGPLDVAGVTDRVAVYGRHRVRVAYTIRTHGPFRTRDLTERHRNITLELGTTASGASHNITIYASDGRLRATLISNATRRPVAELAVSRPGERAVRVRGPRRLIGARRYFVVTRYEKRSTAPCGWAGDVPVTCGDDVPNRGWLRLDRPAWPRVNGVRAT